MSDDKMHASDGEMGQEPMAEHMGAGADQQVNDRMGMSEAADSAANELPD